MRTTNHHLAPPAKTVDGLLAVPIDIQRVSARLTFDGATSTGVGDATLEFIMGPQDGNPIFDLRQTITSAWLDGTPLPVSKLAHHDFGGGANADLRIVESVLAAGSAHTMRVIYSLGLPQASMAGSYLPTIKWTAGPRLAFNFGFTDLGAGRYLEAWVPANLIFDQFELDIELQVLNTTIAHSLITNGKSTVLSPNHWMVSFPAHSTAFSPLVELRATDTLASMTDMTTLPISGQTVSIQVWKLASNPVDLGTQINHLKFWLANNENSTGPYLHDGRFVAFVHQGGMEYDGGTTSSPGALKHETFHSWWARGLKPASQPDAWFDEAWAVYNDNGAIVSLPFDFTDPPVELCPANPWIRRTASNSYDDGNRFWEGVAGLIGAANLRTLMGEFYKAHNARPATTTDIEGFLVCRSGNPQLVDAFHRFVYGYGDPSPIPDLWLRDDPAHGGSEAWTGRFWDSPDLWIRNSDDGGTGHEPPEFGQDNWFYARVRNRSVTATARHFLVTFNVKPFAGTQFSYPADFLPCIAAAAGFDLGPGNSMVVKARWPAALVPPTGTHPCLLAAVLTRFDQPIAGRHVWEHNNLAQKNLTIVDLVANSWIVVPFVVANLEARIARRFRLELVRPADRIDLRASLIHRSEETFRLGPDLDIRPFTPARPTPVADALAGADCGAGTGERLVGKAEDLHRMLTPDNMDPLAIRFGAGLEGLLPCGRTAQIAISLRPQEQRVLGLRLHVPPEAKSGEVIRVDLVQRDGAGKNILGGIAIEIHVR